MMGDTVGKYINVSRKLITLLCCVLLASCSLMKPVPVTESKLYMLAPEQVNVVKGRNTNKTIMVSVPQAASPFMSAKMAYMKQAFQIQYFSDNRWAAAPAKLLQPYMVQALQQTGAYHAVVAAPFTGKTDLRLDTELVELVQDFDQLPSRVRFTVVNRLVNTNNQRVIASKRFEFVTPAPMETPYGGVIASNYATSKYLHHLTQFVNRAA